MREYKETYRTLRQKSAADLALYSAGTEACRPYQEYGPIYRAYHVIHFVTAGAGTLEIDGLTLPVGAGDAFIIPAGKVSRYEADAADPWTYSWVNFLGVNAQTYVGELLRAAPEHYVARGLECDRYATLVQGIIGLGGPATTQYLRGNSLLFEVISELLEDVGFDEKDLVASSVIDDVKFFLDVNYSRDLRLSDVARRFAVSPDYLSRAFKAAYGVSPKRYLMNLKLERAASLLETTELPVSVVARSLGFADPLAFSRTFSHTYGSSPTAWRASGGADGRGRGAAGGGGAPQGERSRGAPTPARPR